MISKQCRYTYIPEKCIDRKVVATLYFFLVIKTPQPFKDIFSHWYLPRVLKQNGLLHHKNASYFFNFAAGRGNFPLFFDFINK